MKSLCFAAGLFNAGIIYSTTNLWHISRLPLSQVEVGTFDRTIGFKATPIMFDFLDTKENVFVTLCNGVYVHNHGSEVRVGKASLEFNVQTTWKPFFCIHWENRTLVWFFSSSSYDPIGKALLVAKSLTALCVLYRFSASLSRASGLGKLTNCVGGEMLETLLLWTTLPISNSLTD